MGGKGSKVKEPQQRQYAPVAQKQEDVYISFDTMPTLYIDRKMREMQIEEQQQQQQQFGYNMQPVNTVFPIISAKYQPTSPPVSFIASEFTPIAAPSPATFQPMHKIRSRSLPHFSSARQTPWPIVPQPSYVVQQPLQSIPEVASFQTIQMLPSRTQTATQIMQSRISTQIIPLPQQQQEPLVIHHLHKRMNKLRSRSHGSYLHHKRRSSHRVKLPRISALPENATIISDKIYMLPIDQPHPQQHPGSVSFFKQKKRLIRPGLGLFSYNNTNSRRTSIETQTTRTLTEHLSVSENEEARNKERRRRKKNKNNKKLEESESTSEIQQRTESKAENTDTSSVIQSLRSRLHSTEGRN